MFIEPTITWVPSGFSGYIRLDKNCVEKKNRLSETTLSSNVSMQCVYLWVVRTGDGVPYTEFR